jgi:hypothetical protein
MEVCHTNLRKKLESIDVKDPKHLQWITDTMIDIMEAIATCHQNGNYVEARLTALTGLAPGWPDEFEKNRPKCIFVKNKS